VLCPSAPSFTRALTLAIVGWVALLGAILLTAILCQGISSTRDTDRQKIITALDHATADMRELILAVEMTADSVDRIVHTIRPANAVRLRAALEMALSAFEQRPELSHLGVVLPDTGEYGNLERSADGDIFLWLYPGGKHEDAVTHSFRLTNAGFVPHASYRGKGYDLRIRPVYQAAIQSSEQGTWMPTHPWIVHGDQYGPLWGFSYVKALYDDTGRLAAVLDANFDMTALQVYVDTLQTLYDLRLDVIELGDDPKHIGGGSVTRAPQPLPAAFSPLLTTAQNHFADTMYVDAQRRWVTTHPLELQGGVSWLLVASRAAPLLDAALGKLLYHVLGILLIIAAGLTLISIRMARRFGQPLAELAQGVTRIGQTGQHVTTVSSLNHFREIQLLGHALEQASEAITQQTLLKEQEQMRLQTFNAELEYLATHDDLTGLPNHLLIQRHIAQAIAHAQESERVFALLYLDLDRFKVVNDSYGHMFGNRVLKAIGEEIRHLVRTQDTVAHLSSDRFLVLLTALRDADEATRLTCRILHGLNRPIQVEERNVRLTASIGVSIFPQHGNAPDTLISNADLAMYRAKQLGRNTYQIFTQAIQQETQERIYLETRLRDAVAQRQLHLVYQPKASLRTGRITGCEALLRWTHPELGAIPPSRFIPIAEDSGLIIPIGDWVLNTACTQAKAWLDAGLSPVRVAVNLSAHQFLQQDVATWVRAALQRTGLPADCLELELTESLFPHDMEHAIHTINQIQAIGVQLALDDFGTGYSNLSHLQRFHMHTLKIDQVFVRNAVTAKQDAAIVQAAIDLAHTLNFKALAEGVETAEHVQLLRAQQCDEIQGYYFSAPLAAEAFEKMLRDGTKLAE